MATLDPALTGVTSFNRRVLVIQKIDGCLADAIGPHGLDRAALDRRIATLAPILDELKAGWKAGVIPHFAITDRDDDIAEAEAVLAKLSAGAATIVFLGTGGSSLGGQTLAQLSGWDIPGGADEGQKKRPRTRFYDNLDGATLSGALKTLDLARTRFVVISKSGSTAETLAQMVAAISAYREAGLGEQISSSFLGVSDPFATGKSNGLRDICAALAIPVLEHPPGIGGRFSCLTIVGLLPAIARGLDARKIRAGAKAAIGHALEPLRPSASAPAVGAAIAVALAEDKGIRVNVMMPYADRLGRFAAWYVQLWAESLGKGGKGTTPLAAQGPLDQHSQLQLFMDGAREHYITIVRTRTAGIGPKLDPELSKLAGIGFMGDRTIGDFVAAQTEAVPEALAKAGRPVRTIELVSVDEESLGALLMMMMLETMFAARLLGVDAFDQPAVELAKVLTRERLGKGA